MGNHTTAPTGSGKEAGTSTNVSQRDVEGIAKAYKTGSFTGSIDVEDTCKELQLVGHDSHRTDRSCGQTDDDVLGTVGMHLKKLTIVDDCTNHLIHVVGFCWGLSGTSFSQSIFETVNGIIVGV